MRINTNNFFEPESNWILDEEDSDYLPYWREQQRRCKEGHSIGGLFMPGRLYFHINFGTIEHDTKEGNKTFKRRQRPILRDCEWVIFDKLEEAEKTHKGVILFTSRGTGKSFAAASILSHNFLFYRDSEGLITSDNESYISSLWAKAELCLNNVPKPFRKSRLGTPKEGVWAAFKDPITGQTSENSFNSRIFLINYKDKPTAAVGKRCKIHIFEEIGTMKNLILDYNASIDCWLDSDKIQFGIPLLIGTGGEMQKGGDAIQMFEEPEAYNLVSIDDRWEGKGKIGLFIPCTWAQNSAKDKKKLSEYLNIKSDCEATIMVTDEEKAKPFFDKMREEKAKASDPSVLWSYKANNPLIPSEVKIKLGGKRFDWEGLRLHLFNLEYKKKDLGRCVDLSADAKGLITATTNKLKAITKFPLKSEDDKKGSVIIYEEPIENPPYGMYHAALDPYDQDEGTSLGSIKIYKRFMGLDEKYGTQRQIVAEYIGRPQLAVEFYDICRKLQQYYHNAVCLTENVNRGIITTFTMWKCLYLLADTPKAVLNKIHPNSTVNRAKGIHATEQIWGHFLELIKQYLLEELAVETDLQGNVIKSVKGWTRIPSPELVRELLAYDDDDRLKKKANYDGIVSFGLCLLQEEETYYIKPPTEAKKNPGDFFGDITNFYKGIPRISRKGY